MKSFIMAFAVVFMYFLAFIAFEWLIGMIFATNTVVSCIGAAVCIVGLAIAQSISYVEMKD